MPKPSGMIKAIIDEVRLGRALSKEALRGYNGVAWVCCTCGDITWDKSDTCEYCRVNGRKERSKWIKLLVATYDTRHRATGIRVSSR